MRVNERASSGARRFSAAGARTSGDGSLCEKNGILIGPRLPVLRRPTGPRPSSIPSDGRLYATGRTLSQLRAPSQKKSLVQRGRQVRCPSLEGRTTSMRMTASAGRIKAWISASLVLTATAAVAPGCRVDEKDVHRWEGTQHGPDR